jgi:hypothetical protein
VWGIAVATEEINRRRFQVAYVSDDADDHSMDAETLGPALAAFGKLLKAADKDLNTQKTAVRVLVNSDFEHKCFNINFELVQTVIREMNDLLSGAGIKNATELLTKVGIIGGTTVGSVIGYLKWKNGRKVEAVQSVQSSPHTVVVKIQGDGNTINIGADVLRLAQNNEVLDAVEGTLAPIGESKVAKSIEFREDDTPTAALTNNEVRAVLASCADRLPEPEREEPEDDKKTVTAVLYTYGPVFDAKAPNWRFRYRNKPIYADVRETSIAKDAVRRGKSSMNDRYKVRM